MSEESVQVETPEVIEFSEENYSENLDLLENPEDYDESMMDQDTNENNAAKDKKSTEKPEQRAHLKALPLGRIKNIMKLDQEVNIISAESLFLITKATEFFIENMSKEAFVHTAQAKKKTLQKKDLDLAISSVDSLMFLDGAVN